MHFISSLLEVRYLRINEKKIEDALDQNDNICITEQGLSMGAETEQYKREIMQNMFLTYLTLRKQRRQEHLNLVQSSLRMMMLANLLRLPGSDWIDEVIVTVFGITSNFIGISKQVSLIKEQHKRLAALRAQESSGKKIASPSMPNLQVPFESSSSSSLDELSYMDSLSPTNSNSSLRKRRDSR